MLAVLGDSLSTLIAGLTIGAYGGRSTVALLMRRWHKDEPTRRAALAYAWIGVVLMVGYFTWTLVHFILVLTGVL
jgi:protein-S-isoprenylcysteine O-methyltransferase Ste14